jgi:hypothetical protein
MLPQVLAELREAAEWDQVPETASAPALEQTFTHGARDGAVRGSIVRQFPPGSVHDAESLEARSPPALSVSRDA